MTKQKQLLTSLLERNKEAVIIGSLGTISYDLKEIEHPNKILIKGAMGAAIACGIGYAMGTDKKVIVFIGEGALLMKLGSTSSLAHHDLDNLEIHVMVNHQYKSCGGQPNYFRKWSKKPYILTCHEV